MSNNNYLPLIMDFIRQVGIDIVPGLIHEETFLPGIKIQNGALIYQMDKLQFPGDLLHEAGHIAVSPSEVRQQLQNDVSEFGQGPAEEMAAIAWSWAAITYLKIPAEVVFHENGYKGASQSHIEAFSTGGGFGYPLLSYWKMCATDSAGKPAFPVMLNWLRS